MPAAPQFPSTSGGTSPSRILGRCFCLGKPTGARGRTRIHRGRGTQGLRSVAAVRRAERKREGSSRRFYGGAGSSPRFYRALFTGLPCLLQLWAQA